MLVEGVYRLHGDLREVMIDNGAIEHPKSMVSLRVMIRTLLAIGM